LPFAKFNAFLERNHSSAFAEAAVREAARVA